MLTADGADNTDFIVGRPFWPLRLPLERWTSGIERWMFASDL